VCEVPEDELGWVHSDLHCLMYVDIVGGATFYVQECILR